MSRTCKALLKDYCSNCTFAGIHYVADDTKHWIERWLWAALVILSWYGSAVLIIAAWDAFVNSPISCGVETTYKDWSTQMPTVAICEGSNDNRLYEVADTIWPPDHLIDLEDALKDIVYFRGLSYSLVDVCYNTPEPDPLCPVSNFSYYANLVRSDCAQIIKNCSYNDNRFDCCDYFLPIDTDIGTCFILNSIQTKNPNPYPMVSNMKQKRGVIKFRISVQSTMYTLGPEEVPSVVTLSSSTLKIQLGHNYRRLVTVKNIENDPLVAETTPKQRACRFYSENEDGLYPYYSYSACTVLCRKQAQLEYCHCNDHFMIGTKKNRKATVTTNKQFQLAQQITRSYTTYYIPIATTFDRGIAALQHIWDRVPTQAVEPAHHAEAALGQPAGPELQLPALLQRDGDHRHQGRERFEQGQQEECFCGVGARLSSHREV